MARLTAAQLGSRRAFDFQVVSAMSGTTWTAMAYTTTLDLECGTNPITAIDQAHRATRYKVDYAVPTLVGPGRLADRTVIGFALDVDGYPFIEPMTWIISPHVPYSPHFLKGSPVCIGEIWRAAKGKMLLGQLFNHIARMLNWDEQLPAGYDGWNGAAIKYHRRHYRGKPLNPQLRYPTPPVSITHGIKPASAASLVDLRDTTNVGPANCSGLFEAVR